jgi:integrase
MSEVLLDRAGRRRSPATMPGFHAGHAPGNKGLRYPADPPKLEEIIAVMRTAGGGAHGHRLRGLIVIMWRAGLRIQEALALTEGDPDQRRGSVLVRRGTGGRRRQVGMDAWGWEQLLPWLDSGARFRSVRCSASSTARRADATGHPPRLGQSCVAPPPRQECGAASRHISSATPTPSRWPAKAFR